VTFIEQIALMFVSVKADDRRFAFFYPVRLVNHSGLPPCFSGKGTTLHQQAYYHYVLHNGGCYGRK
jgi:hypothetical protein